VIVVETPETVRIGLGDNEFDWFRVDTASDVRVDVGWVDDRQRRRHAWRSTASSRTWSHRHDDVTSASSSSSLLYVSYTQTLAFRIIHYRSASVVGLSVLRDSNTDNRQQNVTPRHIILIVIIMYAYVKMTSSFQNVSRMSLKWRRTKCNWVLKYVHVNE